MVSQRVVIVCSQLLVGYPSLVLVMFVYPNISRLEIYLLTVAFFCCWYLPWLWKFMTLYYERVVSFCLAARRDMYMVT